MTREEVKIMRANIVKGLEISFSRLVESKKAQNGELIFSSKGKIIKVKASDIH